MRAENDIIRKNREPEQPQKDALNTPAALPATTPEGVSSKSILDAFRKHWGIGAAAVGVGAGFFIPAPESDVVIKAMQGTPAALRFDQPEGRADLPPRPVVVKTSLENVAEVEKLILNSIDPSRSSWSRQEAERELADLDPGARQLLPIARDALRNLASSEPEWKRNAYNTFIQTRELGIEYPARIPDELLPEIIKNRQNLEADSRPLALLVYCKGDFNGSFYYNHNTFEDLIAQKYRVVYYEAESDAEFAGQVKAATRGQKAELLNICGHGNRTGLWLERDSRPLSGHKGYIGPADEAWMRAGGVQNCLTSGGQIILDSCNNGEGQAARENVANFMRRLFPHALEKGIWSAQDSYGWIEFHFDANGKLIRVEYPVPEYRAKDGPNTIRR